jgi:LysR family glycine cleavage system transcriptional activator
MVDPTPPLTALRAFEAAARHMSFAKAADELSVTPAALSFQIKTLEERLGAPLFVRLNRAVALTDAGRALKPDMEAGFEALRRGWAAARRRLDTNRVTVTAGPGFTAKWLAPRIGRFMARHPTLELMFSASLHIADFDRDGVDLAIRFGAGTDEGLFSERLFEEWVTPMMRPDIAARVAEPRDLLNETLIVDDSMAFLVDPVGWPGWLSLAGVNGAPTYGPRFSQADHAIDIALQGAGVVLGRHAIAETSLKEGGLVAPFALSIRTGTYFRLVCPEGQEDRPNIKAFREWVREEAEATLADERERDFRTLA